MWTDYDLQASNLPQATRSYLSYMNVVRRPQSKTTYQDENECYYLKKIYTRIDQFLNAGVASDYGMPTIYNMKISLGLIWRRPSQKISFK